MLVLGLAVVAAALLAGRPAPVKASDHDDGETDFKTRNLSITDVYAFREDDLNIDQATYANNLIVMMLTNPRSLPRQQYAYNPNARYIIHVNAAGTDRADLSTRGDEDLQFRFTFGAFSDTTSSQSISCDVIPVVGGVPDTANAQSFPNFGTTTPASPGLGSGTPLSPGGGPTNASVNPTPVINTITPTLNGQQRTINVFAGLREDPFFFDVTTYFKIRAGLLGRGPVVLPKDRATAVDFTKDYGVSAIVMRIPIAALQVNNDTVFDFWATIETAQ
jgi:hypothetical protein